MTEQTVKDQWNMACPACCSDGSLDVIAAVHVRILAGGTDTEIARNGDVEWTPESPASCCCGWNGTVKQTQAASDAIRAA